MALGKIYNVNSGKHLFHIHTYKTDDEKWQEGQIFTTDAFNRIGYINNIPKRLRENEFEKVRNNSYSNLPSRYSCLFLSDSIELAKYWAEKIKNRTGYIQCLDIELLSGKYVYVDEQIYHTEHFLQKEMQKEANCYWRGEKMEEDSIITVLFEGTFKVHKEILLQI